MPRNKNMNGNTDRDMDSRAGCCSVFNPDASETVAYNNPLFPAYIRYGVLSRYPDYSAISHWHVDLEFILVKKGKMAYNVNGELVELSEGDGIMVNSRQIHHGFSEERSECEFICVIISPELLRGNEWFYRNYIEHITENPSFPYLHLTHKGWQAAVLEEIDKLYGRFGDGFTDASLYFELIEGFCAVMKILYGHFPATGQSTGRDSSELISLKNMITHIEEHFAEPITLEDLSLAGVCCKSRCSLLFKRYLRDTPVSYITKLRLRKSLAALLESDLCITDIAYEYGFGGASYYCETFRKYYGMPPLKYKREQRGTK